MRNLVSRFQAFGVVSLFAISQVQLLQVTQIQPEPYNLPQTPTQIEQSLDGEFMGHEVIGKIADERVVILQRYLETQASPLAPYAHFFVESADRYGVDWKLVPAITGIESGFGKALPASSYNAFGWANGRGRFENWEESINTVNKGLKERYMDRGALTVDQISRIYCPPNSRKWAWAVNHFMDEIDTLQRTIRPENLTESL
ncbi:MAG TPA: hypothetical protein VJ179_03465 [Patescibacteria group bacterium]|nr:hypothetical protein [Patescibacteria group bacterium]